MSDPNLIKVCLTNKGEDTETPWAADLGPAGSDGSRKVKLVNVPFMHAKPTWGDTIIVKPTRNDGPPTWDRDGVPWKQIATKIVEDGGRWAMIIDYTPQTSADEAFAALGKACDDAKIVCEGAWAPRDQDPGRVYLAVQKELSAEQVMGILVGASLPMDLIQIHPEPKKKQRAQTVVGISDDAGRPPAAKAARATTEAPVVAKSGAANAAKPAKSETSAATKSGASAKSEKSGAIAKSEPSTAKKPIANATPAAKSEVAKKAAPAKPAPAKPTAAKAAPAKAAPAKATPAKAAPAKAAAPAPTKAAPAPAKAAPAKAASVAGKPAPKAAPAKPAATPAAKAPAKPAAKAPTKPAKKK